MRVSIPPGDFNCTREFKLSAIMSWTLGVFVRYAHARVQDELKLVTSKLAIKDLAFMTGKASIQLLQVQMLSLFLNKN